MLDELTARGLTAWFCVVGKRLVEPGGADLVRRALDDGHRVVNHSFTHELPLGEQPTAEHAQQEIVAMHDLMHDLLGDWGQRWFRPFGREGRLGRHVFSDAALSVLASLQYSVLMWNSVPRDWVDTSEWVARALDETRLHDDTVVVLHDIGSGAMRHLPRFLDGLGERGIEIVSEPPTSCVPIRAGRQVSDLSALTRGM